VTQPDNLHRRERLVGHRLRSSRTTRSGSWSATCLSADYAASVALLRSGAVDPDGLVIVIDSLDRAAEGSACRRSASTSRSSCAPGRNGRDLLTIDLLSACASRARDLGGGGLAVGLRQRLPALIAANSVLLLANRRVTRATTSP
jgi:hypothetical protein